MWHRGYATNGKARKEIGLGRLRKCCATQFIQDPKVEAGRGRKGPHVLTSPAARSRAFLPLGPRLSDAPAESTGRGSPGKSLRTRPAESIAASSFRKSHSSAVKRQSLALRKLSVAFLHLLWEGQCQRTRRRDLTWCARSLWLSRRPGNRDRCRAWPRRLRHRPRLLRRLSPSAACRDRSRLRSSP